MHPIRTVGHGTLSAGAFATLLSGADVEMLVDVRRHPGSRRHPHFGGEAMAGWLPDHGIACHWLPALGGRRRGVPGSPNVGLRNEQFRAYADHMATGEFADAVAELVDVAEHRRTAVLCAEALWWRCHRRLLADQLVMVNMVPVEHLFHDGRLARHEPTAGARRTGGVVRYDDGRDRLFP